MYLDTSLRPQGEQQQVGTLKLSEAIRIGAKKITEVRGMTLMETCGCAIGIGYVGLGHTFRELLNGPSSLGHDAMETIYVETGVPRELLRRIWNEHSDGKKSALEYADWLEAQGL